MILGFYRGFLSTESQAIEVGAYVITVNVRGNPVLYLKRRAFGVELRKSMLLWMFSKAM
jgi:hypothetical protein